MQVVTTTLLVLVALVLGLDAYGTRQAARQSQQSGTAVQVGDSDADQMSSMAIGFGISVAGSVAYAMSSTATDRPIINGG